MCQAARRARARGRARTLRLGLAAGCLAVAAASLALPPGTGLAQSSQAVAVDRQDYVSDAGPDIYQTESLNEGTTGPDPVDIHVAAVPQRTTYHSFLHLELEALAPGAEVEQLLVVLHPTTNPNRAAVENVDTSQAILDAFPLVSELPVAFDPSHPPAYDAHGPEAVGRLNDADGSWSFDLTAFLPYWRQHGNTGLAILPDAGAATTPWAIGFDRTLSVARAVLAAPPTTSAPAAAAPATTNPAPPASGALPLPGAVPPPVAAPLPAASLPASIASAAPAGSPSPGSAGPVQPQAAGGPRAFTATLPPPPAGAASVSLWLLLLTASLAAAAALLAQPVSQALASTAGPRLGLLTELRHHPRLFAAAALLVAWSTTFSVYANTLGGPGRPGSGSRLSAESRAGSGAGTLAPSGGSTPTPAAPGTAAAGPGGSGTAAHTGSGAASAPGAAAAASGTPSSAGGGASGGFSAGLFAPSEERIGLTDTTIQMCAHAALTFADVFSLRSQDLNVFWQMVDDAGGIWGRKVVQPDGTPGISFQDDGYQPSRAVTAAQQCADQSGGSFLLLGGIGFDQIPAVRVWAEQHHMLYIHHIATQQGTDGLRYSFTMLPTLEQVGAAFGDYYLRNQPGSKVGIIYRNSSNWDPGRLAFERTLARAGQGGNIVDRESVNNNQGDYSTQLVKLKAAGAQLVLIWENALAATEIIQQAHNQGWDPAWLLFPFNLTLETLNGAGVDTSRLQGLFPAPAYTCHAADQPQYAAYRAELQRFEAAYQKYDPGANLCGDGGDLLFATWEAWEQVADLLYQCGRDCSRDRIAALMLQGYHATVGANCAVDFRGGDGHHGGTGNDWYRVTGINGSNAWYDTALCVSTAR